MAPPRPDALLLAGLLAATPLLAQQVADTAFRPVILEPTHPAGRGPIVAIDEAHHNFHTGTGRFAPFAALLTRDGYQVISSSLPFDSASLARVGLLVVANAVAPENARAWIRPILPAFTEAEVRAVRAWVERGGSLLLIADHMPFGEAAAGLGQAFGFAMAGGFVGDSAGEDIPPFTRADGSLRDHPVTRGRSGGEAVTQVRSFTGQAFTVPPGAEPLLVLPAGSVTLLPDTAWRFSANTPRTPAAGLAQGAVRRFGRGRVAVFGEAAMFTAQLAGPNRARVGMNAPGAEGNATLALNLVRWLLEPN
ncbi:MAG: DUF4350 domain-containing protein [Gemmatimonadota bacterium]|nr:DUF4350 domain-containing protein [Gemmatimonadota bacterium]